MSYTKQNFTDGQVLTAAALNHMEAGIEAAGQGELDTSELTFSVYKKLLDSSSASAGSGTTISSKGDTFSFSGNSGNYAEFIIPVSSIEKQMMRITATVTALSGNVKMMLAGILKNSTTAGTVDLQTISETEKVAMTVDLAYQDVYGTLDMAKTVTLRFAFTAANASITMNDFVISEKVAESAYIKDAGSTLPQILDAISADIAQSKSSSTQYMVAPNGKKYILQAGSDGSLVSVPVIPNKALFIGNSLLVGFGSFGMCATSAEKDYYYHVTQTITAQNSGFVPVKTAGGGIEGATDTSGLDTAVESIASKLTSDLDLVLVQLGDNINTDEKITYFKDEGCVRLLQTIRGKCPKARVCWVAAWYTTSEKQAMFKAACAQTGCLFIDISDLTTDENRGKIGDVINKGDTTETVTAAGVASHPGDKGMLAIANRICDKLNITQNASSDSGTDPEPDPDEPDTGVKTVLSTDEYYVWTTATPLMSGYNLPLTTKANFTLKGLKFKLRATEATSLEVIIYDTVQSKNVAEATAEVVANTTEEYNEVEVAFDVALVADRFYKIWVGAKSGSKCLCYPAIADSKAAENDYFTVLRDSASDYTYSQSTIKYGGYVMLTV